MTTALTTYLNFRRESREAMEFYHRVFGGDLQISTFDDFGMPVDEGDGGLVMHAQLTTPQGFTLMASDVPAEMPFTPAAGISIALHGDEEETLEAWFTALAEGGRIGMPLETPPWGGRYGTVTDRFGIDWQVVIDTGSDASAP
ncbi:MULTISPECIES: VOC family protein [Microbacterium]|jgi:PhnB protein|uniref:VOC family protein n=1 Tax=Microbacterium TaxID=33882 RepID=UPI001D17A4E7|nr:VOC family protein [Microbacterium testaceum]MCC4247378.1 VOC family protein [Microbacterium testaceum]